MAPLRLAGELGESFKQQGTVWTSPTRTCIPTCSSRISPDQSIGGIIVAYGNVMQCAGPTQLTIEQRVEVSHRLTQSLIYAGNQARPQGSYRTGAADIRRHLTIHQNGIA